MFCIVSSSNHPAFNLAAEEYLFRNFLEDVFFLYVNSSSIVVGKHQNALAEVNHAFVRENKIPVIRRLSGGGAVYHDLGNLNFSFHQTVTDTAKLSFKKFNEPVVEVLKNMGIPAEISPRNDIMVEEFKVSGHADHVFRNRVLSHGTLLFNANRDNLSKALRNESGTFSGKAIQSVRSKVANLVDFLPSPVTMEVFVQKIIDHILAASDENSIHKLSKNDALKIQHLADEKYAQWEWNFGYSPKYWFEKTIEALPCSVTLKVEKGIITELAIGGDFLSPEQKKAIERHMVNSPHHYESILNILSSAEINRPQLIACFF